MYHRMAIRSFAFAVHTQTCDSPESATWVTICPLKKSGFGSGERIGRERKAERGGQVVERGGTRVWNVGWGVVSQLIIDLI